MKIFISSGRSLHEALASPQHTLECFMLSLKEIRFVHREPMEHFKTHFVSITDTFSLIMSPRQNIERILSLYNTSSDFLPPPFHLSPIQYKCSIGTARGINVPEHSMRITHMKGIYQKKFVAGHRLTQMSFPPKACFFFYNLCTEEDDEHATEFKSFSNQTWSIDQYSFISIIHTAYIKTVA